MRESFAYFGRPGVKFAHNNVWGGPERISGPRQPASGAQARQAPRRRASDTLSHSAPLTDTSGPVSLT
eukprot:1202677-Prymnesium_polylepis.1